MTDRALSAKQLRASLPEMVKRVRRGERFTVLYRSRPAFRIVPVTDEHAEHELALEDDPLYRDEWLKKRGLLVSTDFVMDETLTLVRTRLGLEAAERWWEQVEGSPRLRW